MLLKIIGVGLCGCVINTVLKQIKPEFCLISNICVGLVVFAMIVGEIKEIVQTINYINELSSIKMDVVTPIIKVMGIGYITEFAADLAEESGNKSVATKMLLGGKIAICVLALPILKELLNVIFAFI